MRNKRIEILFIVTAIFLLDLINLASIIFEVYFGIDCSNGISIHSFLTFPLIWGFWIFISLKIFRKLPMFICQPLLRIILLAPIVYLDFMDERTDYLETPQYFIYLYNDGLLPISSLLMEPLNHMKEFQHRLIYSNLILWIGFALIQAVILYFAEKIIKLAVKRKWLIIRIFSDTELRY